MLNAILNRQHRHEQEHCWLRQECQFVVPVAKEEIVYMERMKRERL